MSGVSPSSPLRANHRFIMKIVEITLGGKTIAVPDEFSNISRVFSRMGGSWKRLFLGSTEDILLLKKIVKIAYKKGFLTKKQLWK